MKRDPARGRVRVPIALEEAPAFLFFRGQTPRFTSYETEIGSRVWKVTMTGAFGFPNSVAQKVWLALCQLHDEQRDPAGVVRYSLPLLAERLRLSGGGGAREQIATAVRQIEGTNIYVTGEPLPDDDPRKRPEWERGGRKVFLYRFLDAGGWEQFEERPKGQLVLLSDDQDLWRDRLRSATCLSDYVVRALSSSGGRIVPEWIFDLSSPYAVRLARLLAKRANDRPTYTIDRMLLVRALPALTRDGELQRYPKVRDRLNEAYEELRKVGFLSDIEERHNGKLHYKFGPAARTTVRLTREQTEVLEKIIEIVGPADGNRNRYFYIACMQEGISLERMLGLLHECARSGRQGLPARYGATLQKARELRKEEVENIVRSSLGL